MSKADYTEEERARVWYFYFAQKNQNFYQDFLLQRNLTGLWMARLVLPQSKALSTDALEANKNLISAIAPFDEKLIALSLAYGSKIGIIPAAAVDSLAFETYQVSADFLEPNIETGYEVHRSFRVSLYPIQSGNDKTVTYGVRFDQRENDALKSRLLVPDDLVRIEEIYEKNPTRRYDRDGVPVSPLQKSIRVYAGAQMILEFRISGEVVEGEDLPPPPPLGGAAPSSSLLPSRAKFNASFFLSLGWKEFVAYEEAQQVRAAVLANVSKLIAYASVWRIVFAFLNSITTAAINRVPSERNKDGLLYCIKNVQSSIKNFAVLYDYSNVPVDVYTQTDNEIRTIASSIFSGWNLDATRKENCRIQAERICRNTFVPTVSFEKEKREKTTINQARLDDFKEIAAECAKKVTAVNVDSQIKTTLRISSNGLISLTSFKRDFASKFEISILVPAALADDAINVSSRLYTQLDVMRRRAQTALSKLLKAVSTDDDQFVTLMLSNIVEAQQLLMVVGILSNCMVSFQPIEQKADISAAQRGSERLLAKYVAQFILDLLPKQRRTKIKETEKYADELQKIVDGKSSTNQVPVPDASDLLDFIDARFSGVDRFADLDIIAAGLSYFYSEQRRYFFEWTNVAWAISEIDVATFRGVILSVDDRNSALDLLQRANARLHKAEGSYDKMDIDDVDEEKTIADSSLKRIVGVILNDFNLAEKSVTDKTYNLFAILRQLLHYTEQFFANVEEYKRLQLNVVDTDLYAAITFAEDNAYRVLQLAGLNLAQKKRESMSVVSDDEESRILRELAGGGGGVVSSSISSKLGTALSVLNSGIEFRKRKRRTGPAAPGVDDSSMAIDPDLTPNDESSWETFRSTATALRGNAIVEIWSLLSNFINGGTNEQSALANRKAQVLTFLNEYIASIVAAVLETSADEQERAYASALKLLRTELNQTNRVATMFLDKMLTGLSLKKMIDHIGGPTASLKEIRAEIDQNVVRDAEIDGQFQEQIELVAAWDSEKSTDEFISSVRDEVDAPKGLERTKTRIGTEKLRKFHGVTVLKASDANRLNDVAVLFKDGSGFKNLYDAFKKAETVLVGKAIITTVDLREIAEAFGKLEDIYRQQKNVQTVDKFRVFLSIETLFKLAQGKFEAQKKRLATPTDIAEFESASKRLEERRLREATTAVLAAKGKLDDAMKQLATTVAEAETLSKKHDAVAKSVDKLEKEVLALNDKNEALMTRISQINMPTEDDVNATLSSIKNAKDRVEAMTRSTADSVTDSKAVVKELAELKEREQKIAKDEKAIKERTEELKDHATKLVSARKSVAELNTISTQIVAAVRNDNQQWTTDNAAAREAITQIEISRGTIEGFKRQAETYGKEIDAFKTFVERNLTRISNIQAQLLARALESSQSYEAFATLDSNLRFVTAEILSLTNNSQQAGALVNALKNLVTNDANVQKALAEKVDVVMAQKQLALVPYTQGGSTSSSTSDTSGSTAAFAGLFSQSLTRTDDLSARINALEKTLTEVNTEARLAGNSLRELLGKNEFAPGDLKEHDKKTRDALVLTGQELQSLLNFVRGTENERGIAPVLEYVVNFLTAEQPKLSAVYTFLGNIDERMRVQYLEFSRMYLSGFFSQTVSEWDRTVTTSISLQPRFTQSQSIADGAMSLEMRRIVASEQNNDRGQALQVLEQITKFIEKDIQPQANNNLMFEAVKYIAAAKRPEELEIIDSCIAVTNSTNDEPNYRALHEILVQGRNSVLAIEGPLQVSAAPVFPQQQLTLRAPQKPFRDPTSATYYADDRKINSSPIASQSKTKHGSVGSVVSFDDALEILSNVK